MIIPNKMIIYCIRSLRDISEVGCVLRFCPEELADLPPLH